MSDRPDKQSDWRGILALQARIAAVFVPAALALALIAALAGGERKSAPDMTDPTVTGSIR
ncbi:hypothetical protein ATER59S_03189 [Aquamicrobium terrae]|uniref:hypothetical protein n=1 Tax=Mesorhizobium sp. PUT5 TaxID=3454629 RepID=UPI003FA4604A